MPVIAETYCYKCDNPIDIEVTHDGQESVIFCDKCGHGLRYKLSILIRMEDALKEEANATSTY